jgi:hypothetical protein
MRPDNQPRKGRPRVFGPQELPSVDRNVIPVPMFKAKGFRREVSIDLRGHAPAAVVADFTRAIQELCGEGGEWRSEHTIEKRVYHLHFFFEFLKEIKFNRGISEVSAELIDKYERWLIAEKTSSERYGRAILAALIVVMRAMEDNGLANFEPAVSRRLSYVSASPFKGGEVRDAWLRTFIRKAAQCAIATLRRRTEDRSPPTWLARSRP